MAAKIMNMNKLNALCLRIWNMYRDTYPHYGFRAIIALMASIFLIDVMKCFLTIPVKDYYVDTYVYSVDSISLEIDLTIGAEKVLTTYGATPLDSSYARFVVRYSVEEYHTYDSAWNGMVHAKKDSWMECIMDQMYLLAEHDNKCREFVDGYDTTLKFSQWPKTDAYIYSHSYQNCFTAVPLLYIVPPHPDNIQTTKHDNYVNINGTRWMDNETTTQLFGNVVKDSTTYKQLSKHHIYQERSSLLRLPAQSGKKGVIINRPEITEYLTVPSLESMGLFDMLFVKEDISQAYFRFVIRTTGLDTYRINLHTRNGAIINNNLSEELKVLSLHDTQITKKCDHTTEYDYVNHIHKMVKQYDETELHVSFPEKNNIQYIRLFLLTILFGWALEALVDNILKLIPRKIK